MTLPTGYDPATVEYDIAAEGDGVPDTTTFRLEVANLGSTTRAEAFMEAVEAGLQHMAEQMLGISGVTGMHIYRRVVGTAGAADIFEPPAP